MPNNLPHFDESRKYYFTNPLSNFISQIASILPFLSQKINSEQSPREIYQKLAWAISYFFGNSQRNEEFLVQEGNLPSQKLTLKVISETFSPMQLGFISDHRFYDLRLIRSRISNFFFQHSEFRHMVEARWEISNGYST